MYIVCITEKSGKVALSVKDIREIVWETDAYLNYPSVIAHEYWRMYDLWSKENYLALQFKTKDTIESIIKYVVLSVCAWCHDKDIQGRQNSYEMELVRKPLAMGDWLPLARLIIQFLDIGKRGNNPHQLPDCLRFPLLDIIAWDNRYKLVNWRNENIGHGALGFQDSAQFQEDLCEKIDCVTAFLRDEKGYFQEQHLITIAGEETYQLRGYENTARDIHMVNGQLILQVEAGNIELAPFIFHEENRIWFFDHLNRKQRTRLLCYPSGSWKMTEQRYFSELYSQLSNEQRKEVIGDKAIDPSLSRAIDRISVEGVLNQWYVSPDYLIEWLRENTCPSCHKKGVFLLQMERGLGKTTFSEKLNTKYANPEYIDDGIVVRTYHFSRTHKLGIKEFEMAMSDTWSTIYNSSTNSILQFERADTVDDFKKDRNIPLTAEEMALFLSNAKEVHNADSLLLVLDGLDEITDEQIWECLPTEDMLEEGVYILLTGRVVTESDLPDMYVSELADLQVTERLTVTAKSKENQEFLRKFVRQQCPHMSDDDICDLINQSENKIQRLVTLCILEKTVKDANTARDDKPITHRYLDLIINKYASADREEVLNRLVLLLSTVGEQERLNLSDITDLLDLPGVNLEILGLLQDLYPLLSVGRGWSVNDRHYSGENNYCFCNADVCREIREYYPEEQVKSVVEELVQSAVPTVGISMTCGQSTVLAHFADLLRYYTDVKDDRVSELALRIYHQRYMYGKPVDLREAHKIISLYQQIADSIDLKLNTVEIADCYLAISRLLRDSGEHSVALAEEKKAIGLLEMLSAQDQQIAQKLADIYFSRAITLNTVKAYNESLSMLNQCIATYEKLVCNDCNFKLVFLSRYAFYAEMLTKVGDIAKAQEVLSKATEILGKMREGLDETDQKIEFARVCHAIEVQINSEETARHLNEIQTEILEEIVATGNREHKFELGCHYLRSAHRCEIENQDEAFEYLYKALAIFDELSNDSVELTESNVRKLERVAVSYSECAESLRFMNQEQEAEKIQYKSIHLFEKIEKNYELSDYSEFAACLKDTSLTQEPEDAINTLKKAAQCLERQHTGDVRKNRLELVRIYSDIARHLIKNVKCYTDGLEYAQRSINGFKKLDSIGVLFDQTELAYCYHLAADSLSALGRNEEALQRSQQANDIFDKAILNGNLMYSFYILDHYELLARLYGLLGQKNEALNIYQKEVELGEKFIANVDMNVSMDMQKLAKIYVIYARALEEQGHSDEAKESFNKAIAIYERLYTSGKWWIHSELNKCYENLTHIHEYCNENADARLIRRKAKGLKADNDFQFALRNLKDKDTTIGDKIFDAILLIWLFPRRIFQKSRKDTSESNE